jgi:outer membrane lipoprotein-sorting protein
MTPRRSFLGIGLAALLGATCSKRASSDGTDALLDELSQARQQLRSLRASFEQVRRIGILATDVTSRGRMVLVRPDRLRWQLLPPDAVTYWVGPEGLAYATGTSRARVDRVAAGQLGGVLEDLLSFLGGDLRSLRARYELRALRIESGARIEARPRDEAVRKVLRKLEVEVASDLVSPRHVLLEETENELVRVRFFDVERNVEVEPSSMRPPR